MSSSIRYEDLSTVRLVELINEYELIVSEDRKILIKQLKEHDAKLVPEIPPKLFGLLKRRRGEYKDVVESDESFSVIKTSFKTLIKDKFLRSELRKSNLSKQEIKDKLAICQTTEKSIRDLIEDAVIRTNRIMTATYFFLKLYLLKYPEELKNLQRFRWLVAKINTILKDSNRKSTIRTVPKQRKNKKGEEETPEQRDYKNRIQLEIHQRVKEFYNQHLKSIFPRFDGHGLSHILILARKELVTAFKNAISVAYEQKVRKELKQRFIDMDWEHRKELIDKLIKYFNVEVGDELKRKEVARELEEYKVDPESIRKLFVPDQIVKRWRYDLKVNPFRYYQFYSSFQKSLFPLRTGWIPRYIKIDRASLQDLLPTSWCENELNDPKEIWNRFIDTSTIKTRFLVIRSIVTDGVSAGVVFERLIKQKRYLPYFASLRSTEQKKLENRVYIDPGINNLIYCKGDNGQYFRYTNKQRYFECKINQHRDLREGIKADRIVQGFTWTPIQENKTT